MPGLAFVAGAGAAGALAFEHFAELESHVESDWGLRQLQLEAGQ